MSFQASPRQLRHRFAIDPLFRRRFIFGALGVFSVVGWAGLLFCGTLFSVADVEIQGGKGIDRIAAKAAVFQALDQRSYWRPWSPRHVWFIDTQSLAEKLKVDWYADSVQVETHPFSNIVRLIVTEQTNALFVKTPTQYLRVDTQGIVREELSAVDRLDVVQRMAGRFDLASSTEPIIEIPSLTDDVASGYRLPEALEDIRKWFAISKLLKLAKISVRYLSIQPAQIVLFGQDQSPVYLDPSDTIGAQIKGLSEYYKLQKTKNLAQPTQFIDARIPGRVYVK